jgi:hypothetical protein
MSWGSRSPVNCWLLEEMTSIPAACQGLSQRLTLTLGAPGCQNLSILCLSETHLETQQPLWQCWEVGPLRGDYVIKRVNSPEFSISPDGISYHDQLLGASLSDLNNNFPIFPCISSLMPLTPFSCTCWYCTRSGEWIYDV